MHMEQSARNIYQDTLDFLTPTILEKDGERFASRIHAPFEVHTLDGGITFSTRDEVIWGMQSYGQSLLDRGVTRVVRVCDTASFLSEDFMTGYHTTHFLKGNDYVTAAVLSEMSLVLEDNTWKVARTDSAIAASDWPLIPTTFLEDHQLDVAPAYTDPATTRRHLLQSIFDRIDHIFMTGDFEGWKQSIHLPLIFETRSGRQVFETETSLRTDFDRYQHEFKLNGVDSLSRNVKTADMVGDNLMIGTYRVHMKSGAEYVARPWDAAATLRCEDNTWKITKLMRSLGHLNWDNQSVLREPDAAARTPKERDH